MGRLAEEIFPKDEFSAAIAARGRGEARRWRATGLLAGQMSRPAFFCAARRFRKFKGAGFSTEKFSEENTSVAYMNNETIKKVLAINQSFILKGPKQSPTKDFPIGRDRPIIARRFISSFPVSIIRPPLLPSCLDYRKQSNGALRQFSRNCQPLTH